MLFWKISRKFASSVKITSLWFYYTLCFIRKHEVIWLAQLGHMTVKAWGCRLLLMKDASTYDLARYMYHHTIILCYDIWNNFLLIRMEQNLLWGTLLGLQPHPLWPYSFVQPVPAASPCISFTVCLPWPLKAALLSTAAWKFWGIDDLVPEVPLSLRAMYVLCWLPESLHVIKSQLVLLD